MNLYYIDIPTISHIDIKMELGTIVYDLLTFNIPFKLRGHTLDQIFDSTGVMYDLVYNNSYHSDSVQCLITSE